MRETVSPRPQEPERIPDPPKTPIEKLSRKTQEKWANIFNNFFSKLFTTPPPWSLYEGDITIREIFIDLGLKEDPTQEGYSQRRANETDRQFYEAIYKAAIAENIDMERYEMLSEQYSQTGGSHRIAEMNMMLVSVARRLLAEGYTMVDLCI